jgi:hypothetical protein
VRPQILWMDGRSRADPDLVEDVAAETFLATWRRPGELPGHVVPWLLNTS